MCARLLVLLAALVASAAGRADPSLPHIHKGLMTKYEAKPPSSYGISLEGATTEQLRSGRPTVRFIETASGAKRVVSIQDIQASEKTIWKVITDLPNYPKMVEGCNMCAPYKREKLYSGGRVDYARYKIGAMGFKVEYFIKHIFEPKKHCFTFHLDYDRLSELSDTVGYWYVEQLDDGWCRVYYSTDSVLPSWIPGWAKSGLINIAAKTATAWGDKYCQVAQGNADAPRDSPLPSAQRLLQLGLVGYAFRSSWLPSAKLLFGKLAKVLSELRALQMPLPSLPKLPSKLRDSKLVAIHEMKRV